jgi:FkbM family methyltransferase
METDAAIVGKMWDAESKSFIDCDIVYNSRSGYWCRNETFDKAMIRDSLKNYKGFTKLKNSVVLDLGANCGGFTKMALEAGAKKVIALEPCPHNYQVLALNAPDAVCLNAAVSESPIDEVTFYYSDSKRSSSSSSTIERRNFSGVSITVPAYDIMDLLKKYNPNIVKMDIESKEYDILDRMKSIPEYVEEFALEVHRFSPKHTAYLDNFFPENEWYRESKGFKFFGNMRHNDWLFRRK